MTWSSPFSALVSSRSSSRPIEDLRSAELGADDQRVRTSDEDLARMQFARDFLSRFHVNEQPFSTFVSEKFHIPGSRYHRLGFSTHDARLYHECVTLSDKLAHNERERHRLEQLVHDLTPWEPLRLQISEWQGTEHTTLFAGIVPAGEGPATRQLLRDAVTEVTVEEVSPRGPFQAWMVIAHVSVVDDVRLALGGTSFSEVRFEGLTDYPAEEMAKARERIVELDAETAELTERVRELSKSGTIAARLRARAGARVAARAHHGLERRFRDRVGVRDLRVAARGA